MLFIFNDRKRFFGEYCYMKSCLGTDSVQIYCPFWNAVKGWVLLLLRDSGCM
jgi:hypothetical protein